MIKTKINDKWDILLPEHRAIKSDWPYWEAKRLASIYETVQKGDIVYYIGAEEGDMCGLLAMWGAKLVLFEPNDRVWSNIKAIFEANELETPSCFVGFAANTTTSMELMHEWPKCAYGNIIGNHGFKSLIEEGNSLPTIKIDDITSDYPPDMITLDVEGSEFEVLRGAEQTLLNYHPDIYLSLHPEFMFHQYGEYSGDLRKWIKNRGYTEVLLDYQHEVHLYYKYK